MTNMTPEERDAILAAEKQKFAKMKVLVAAILIPLVIFYLLTRINFDNQRVTGTMESATVEHKATGTKTLARVALDRGDAIEVLLPVAIPFDEGKRLEVTESRSLFGSKRYSYPRALGGQTNQ